MTTTTDKPLDILSNEVWDFVGLAADLGLPRIDRVAMFRAQHDEGWRITAHVDHRTPAEAIEAVYAYANYTGGTVLVRTPFAAAYQPSGFQVSLEARIVVVDVRIEIVANLDADRYAEAMVADRTLVHVTGPFAGLLLGGEHA